MAPVPDKRQALVANIRSARAALRTITEPARRKAILDELSIATRELTALLLNRKPAQE